MRNQDWMNLGDSIRDIVDDAINSQNFNKLNRDVSRMINQGLENAGWKAGSGMGDAYGVPPDETERRARKAWEDAQERHRRQQAGSGPTGPQNTGSFGGTGGFGAPGGSAPGAGPGPSGNFGNAKGPGSPGGAGSYSSGRAGMGGYTGGYSGGYSGTDGGHRYQQTDWSGQQHQYQRTDNRQAYREARRDYRQAYGRGNPASTSYGGNTAVVPVDDKFYVRTNGSKAGGMALAIAGFALGGSTALTVLILLLVSIGMGDWLMGFTVTSGILAPFIAVGAIMAWKGTSLLGRVKRFRRYVQFLGKRTYCSIQELAKSVGKSESFVVKDLEKLIVKGWFKQGHLDQQETCLIVSNDTYQQYQVAQKQLEDRQRQEKQKVQEPVHEEPSGKASKEVQEIIDTGNKYIKKIRESNDAIPGEEISRKISRMETIVEKIFQRVGQHPEYVSDLHKFMDYYLPTTVKLLDAYEELDRQPVQGENIINSKKEIEKTLDTLNLAFEKLLDSLFEETAWDVATDISVLQTMLAQEGLTEDGLKAKE